MKSSQHAPKLPQFPAQLEIAEDANLGSRAAVRGDLVLDFHVACGIRIPETVLRWSSIVDGPRRRAGEAGAARFLPDERAHTPRAGAESSVLLLRQPSPRETLAFEHEMGGRKTGAGE